MTIKGSRNGYIREDKRLAVLYLRHSPKPKAAKTLDSIECQRERGHAYATLTQLNIVKEFEFPFVSARKVPFAKRGGREVLAYCLENEVTHIIVQRVDRIFRDLVDASRTIDKLSLNGIRLHASDQGGLFGDFSTANGWLLATVSIMFCEYESRLIAERTSTAMRQQMHNMLCVSSRPPLGFCVPHPDIRFGGRRLTTTDEHGNTKTRGGFPKMEIFPPEVLLLQRIHRLYLDKLDDVEIAKTINREGYRTRQGGKFTPGYVRTTIVKLRRSHFKNGILAWKEGDPVDRFEP